MIFLKSYYNNISINNKPYYIYSIFYLTYFLYEEDRPNYTVITFLHN